MAVTVHRLQVLIRGRRPRPRFVHASRRGIEDVGARSTTSIPRPPQQSGDYEPDSMFKSKISLLNPILFLYLGPSSPRYGVAELSMPLYSSSFSRASALPGLLSMS
ncbi:hypothetical protein NL676_019992 [Syzygium grande]|nr:hypothetical protein NL676_019992 [Syzygium grande]